MVYSYAYSHPVSFQNSSSGTNGTNTTLPVQCVCQQYAECGCDDNGDGGYLASLVGNGSEGAMNATLAQIKEVNGTRRLVVNGTLPNGTTASGGSVSAGGAAKGLAELSGWGMMLAAVAAIVLIV